MTRIRISEAFVASTAKIYSDRVFDVVYHSLELIGEFPEIGSLDLPLAIKQRFGEDCRKVVVDPFDILYRYDQEKDVVYIAELIHQRNVY